MLPSGAHGGHGVAGCLVLLSFRKCSLYFLILASARSSHAQLCGARNTKQFVLLIFFFSFWKEAGLCFQVEVDTGSVFITVREVRSRDPSQLPKRVYELYLLQTVAIALNLNEMSVH